MAVPQNVKKGILYSWSPRHSRSVAERWKGKDGLPGLESTLDYLQPQSIYESDGFDTRAVVQFFSRRCNTDLCRFF
jgi:hypothetical protein